MFLSIKYKVLLTLVVVAAATVLAMALLVKWSFDRGFLRYVSTMERAAQQDLVTALAREYRDSGGWDRLGRNPRLFRDLQLINTMRFEMRRHLTLPMPRVPDPGQAPRLDLLFVAPPPAPGLPFPPARAPAVLFDAGRHHVAGPPVDAAALDLLPIVMADRTVGYLGVRPPPGLSDTHDLYFSERQARALSVIAVAVVALAALLAWPVSRQLVRPIRELSAGTRSLAAGDYDTRLAPGPNDELGQLSADFNSLAETLQQNERARRRWIADISHELRTPLSVLQGEIEAMQDGIRAPGPERLEVLHGQTSNLTRLVQDLYELSLSDSGALSYQKRSTDLGPLLDSCVAARRDAFAGRGIAVSWLPPDAGRYVVHGDPDRLRQLFSNLLANALHYTDAGGRVEISLGAQKDLALVDVRDSAPGVPAEHLPHLFERLYRVDASRSRATGGSGLGLSICRSIVDAHGGTISAASSSLGGLWVHVALPLQTRAGAGI
jgi:two-component system sensor histidine kinase BaeS